MGQGIRRSQRFFICLTLSSVALVPASSQQLRRETTGSIVARDGNPIRGVLVVTSGKGLAGWAASDANGSFKLSTTGEFISFRHVDYKPVLVRSSDLTDPVRIQLIPADETSSMLKSCNSLPAKARGWIGGGLRVNPGGKYRGPVNGEHDSHWYVRRGNDTLHLVDGYTWHSGLPGEDILARSDRISVRDWVFETIVGLDFTGHTTDGKYWRWVGAPLAAAIEYETPSRTTADEFDKVIASMCFGHPH
jgi:hypothetical protein